MVAYSVQIGVFKLKKLSLVKEEHMGSRNGRPQEVDSTRQTHDVRLRSGLIALRRVLTELASRTDKEAPELGLTDDLQWQSIVKMEKVREIIQYVLDGNDDPKVLERLTEQFRKEIKAFVNAATQRIERVEDQQKLLEGVLEAERAAAKEMTEGAGFISVDAQRAQVLFGKLERGWEERVGAAVTDLACNADDLRKELEAFRRGDVASLHAMIRPPVDGSPGQRSQTLLDEYHGHYKRSWGDFHTDETPVNATLAGIAAADATRLAFIEEVRTFLKLLHQVQYALVSLIAAADGRKFGGYQERIERLTGQLTQTRSVVRAFGIVAQISLVSSWNGYFPTSIGSRERDLDEVEQDLNAARLIMDEVRRIIQEAEQQAQSGQSASGIAAGFSLEHLEEIGNKFDMHRACLSFAFDGTEEEASLKRILLIGYCAAAKARGNRRPLSVRKHVGDVLRTGHLIGEDAVAMLCAWVHATPHLFLPVGPPGFHCYEPTPLAHNIARREQRNLPADVASTLATAFSTQPRPERKAATPRAASTLSPTQHAVRAFDHDERVILETLVVWGADGSRRNTPMEWSDILQLVLSANREYRDQERVVRLKPAMERLLHGDVLQRMGGTAAPLFRFEQLRRSGGIKYVYFLTDFGTALVAEIAREIEVRHKDDDALREWRRPFWAGRKGQLAPADAEQVRTALLTAFMEPPPGR
ncbi:hypothetical protein HY478_00830 [Candidatus Uhrbacteria bacterium]|nr:hypothetical protein [Candidatus Uhrbacteria bacterium]